jgi:DNA polymerase III delta subunit
MITLLTGENYFEIERALAVIADGFDGRVEKFEGSDLQLSQLPDILMGASLFATARTIIVKNLSENKVIWPVLGDWLPRVSDDINLVLVEPKPDKRTTTFKTLKKSVTIREFMPWTDRDVIMAEKWVMAESKTMGFELDKTCAQFLVRRVGVDQWALYHALEKLSSVDFISVDVIKNIVDANPTENVFNLFETAIRGDVDELRYAIKILEQTNDSYQLFALLSSQVFQLAAVAYADKNDNVAKDFAIHPFVVSKLTPIAKRIGNSGVAKIVTIFADADADMKTSRAEPWLIVEMALVKVANI